VQEAVWNVNPEMPLNEVRWIEDDVATASLPSRFLAGLIAAFAVFALSLATLALYSAIAYVVLQRKRDIAIRMALGATRAQIVSLILRGGARLVAAGLLLGIAGALALSRILQSQLYGVSATDATTYVGVTLILTTAALLATWLPSRRAANAPPMQTLQS
jgi:putative ABC transport system permease protein